MNAGPIIRSVRLERSALLALHAAYPRRYPALFESAATSAFLGRYDILFAFPGARLTLDGSNVLTCEEPLPELNGFLGALDTWWKRERDRAAHAASLPFRGGWLLFLGYELAGHIETRLRLPQPHNGPIAQAVRIPAAVIFQHESEEAWIVVEEAHATLVAQIEADLATITAAAPAPQTLLLGAVIEEPAEKYLHAIARALDYIAAGDIYQANLSRAWCARLAAGVQPHHVYRRLRQTNPGPFCALAVLDELAVVSSSPERLVQVREGWIATRPIAGTRPRGGDVRADRELARELHTNAKERAEHIMLIDLERNDLGRVCAAGSVEVDEFMTVESYAHVHHIVSNVRGRLRPDTTPGQVLAAVFPGGTITGCPKVRCMEIIAELENEARGAYTGSLGYLNRDGDMDLNILIRSLEIRGDELSLRAGAGIVADSLPERELEETRAKAQGVLRALSQESAPT
jgi:anthranilate synthase component 1